MTDKTLLFINAENIENRCLALAEALDYRPSLLEVKDPVECIIDEGGEHDAYMVCPDALVSCSAADVLVINGPNLNLLGTREPEIYGNDTLDDIASRCVEKASETGMNVTFRQSNHEGEIVDWIQQAIGNKDAIIINAAAYTHTSVAIHDALRAYNGCKVELHISNPHRRELFRHLSYVSSAADVIVAGLGTQSYDLVIELLGEDVA